VFLFKIYGPTCSLSKFSRISRLKQNIHFLPTLTDSFSVSGYSLYLCFNFVPVLPIGLAIFYNAACRIFSLLNSGYRSHIHSLFRGEGHNSLVIFLVIRPVLERGELCDLQTRENQICIVTSFLCSTRRKLEW
jgi:hypothetical protein